MINNIPMCVRCLPGPTPDSSKICGEAIAPALKMTSFLANSTLFLLSLW